MGPDATIVPAVQLPSLCASLRASGRRIVFTNGCFDILHVGHVRYLREAREMGDVLIVGVNSDKSVRMLKGPSRPIVPEDERAEMLSALACVDFVSLFDEATADSIIELIAPQVYVKGGNVDPRAVPELTTVERLGGVMVLAGLTEGRSTTNIIERVLEVHTT